jgi:tRNA dimethylallyltransferase
VLKKPPLIVIAGPTASGKTSLSIALSHRLKGEVVAMDSMQIYRYMDIGTAKPTLSERENIPHHMLDVSDPKDTYSVAEYARQAKNCISDVHQRGKIPILTGGTGLYLKALTTFMELGGIQGDPIIRERLTAIAQEENGGEALHEMLAKVDPESANRLHRNDIRRIIRALEVYELTGKPISCQQPGEQPECPYSLCVLGLFLERETLYKRIDDRVDAMMNMGLSQEVEGLLHMGVPPEAQSMQGLGYKELIPVVKDRQPLHQAVEAIKLGTHHYAKRQMTWFRRTEGILWLDVQAKDLMDVAMEQIRTVLNI